MNKINDDSDYEIIPRFLSISPSRVTFLHDVNGNQG